MGSDKDKLLKGEDAVGSDKDAMVKGEYAHGFGSNWWVGGGRSG